MTPDLLTLTEWATRRYGDAAPSLATLRRWAREALIFPVPKKHGRTYFVQPDAQYLDAESIRHGPTPKIRHAPELARSPSRT